MEIYDPLHGIIEIDELSKRIINTEEFQRLRNIKQLGCCYYVFPGASHNRFEHSLGVYHLAKKYVSILNVDNEFFNESDERCVNTAALIHDIGHGPFSHLFDNYVTETHHEYRSMEIFKNMNKVYNFGYTPLELNFINDVIYPEDKGKDKDKEYLYQIVSNKNGIDVDRFDYMLRDIKMTGIENKYDFDYNFILQIMNNTIIKDNTIFYVESIKYILEMFFQTRGTIYKKVCNHKTVKGIELMMGRILTNLESTFHINESIKNNDWEKYCTYSDTIVHSLDFLSDKSKNNDVAYILYNRIKCRNLYKLIKEHIYYGQNIPFDVTEDLTNYTDTNKYLVNTSVIKYYGDESPRFLDNDKEIYKDFFQGKGKDITLIKVYEI